MDKYEIKKYLIMLIDTADKIKELHSHLENVSGEDISISIIPFFSNEIKKNIEYLNQYTYDIKTCIFTIDDINILAPITDIERTYFALYPTLLDVKLHDKEWGKYSVLCSNLQEIIYLLIKQCNKLKDSNSKHEQIIPNQKEEEKEEQTPINISELKSCFKVAFINAKVGDKEKGDKYETYFEMLIGDLQKKRTMIDYARIALIIHESKKINATIVPKPFKQWYKKFCKITNCKFNENYDKRCKLIGKEFDDLKECLYYL